MSLPLIEKYRAKYFKDIKGQDLAIQDLKIFYKTFPKKRAVIINGPVGTGKTSLAIALANENNLELFELNASDLRNKQKLEEILKPASEQSSLFKKGKIILIDEIDGISGDDRGCIGELIILISKTSFPIIITTNNIWDKKFSLLRSKCQIINLKEIKDEFIIEIIKNVLKKEKKEIDDYLIKLITQKSKGDVRAALNDLQTLISSEEDILTYDKDKEVFKISEREKQEDIFNALKKIFQKPTEKDIINVFDNVDAELDEIIFWIEENIPLEYQGKALAKAQEYLSKADIFKGRIYRHQFWRFLIYENFFLTAGISSATKIKYNKFVQYRRPSRILKIWINNQTNMKKNSIIKKFAEISHMSKRKAAKEFFLLPFIINQKIKNELDLENSEYDYIEEKKQRIIKENKLSLFT
ncbi:MAG: replication factor C large subunit [Candidatus Pacearchaeota archaeon]